VTDISENATETVPFEPRGRRRWMASAMPWLLFIGVFALHWRSPNVTVSDSLQSIPTAMSMLRDHDLHLENNLPPWDTSGYALDPINGHLLPYFPWGAPLFAVPFLAFGAFWAKATGGVSVENYIDKPGNTWPFEVISMSFVVALTSVVIYHVARLALCRLSAGRRLWAAALAAMTFAFGTSAWSTADRALWQHGPSMLFLSLALLAAAIIESEASPHFWRAPTALGAATAAAYVVRPTNSLTVIGLGAWLLLRHRRAIGWAIAGGTPIAVLFLTVNRWQYGTFLPAYFHTSPPGTIVDGKVPDFWYALPANLVSPGRGLFVFSPILLLAVAGPIIAARAGRLTALHVSLAAVATVHLLLISDYAIWWGGYSYGPRLMTDMVPFLLFLSLPALEWIMSRRSISLRRPAAALAIIACGLALAMSIAVYGEGALLRDSGCWNVTPPIDTGTIYRVWDWRDGQWIAGFRGVARFGWAVEMTRDAAGVTGCPP
jgi:hypothetical protein